MPSFEFGYSVFHVLTISGRSGSPYSNRSILTTTQIDWIEFLFFLKNFFYSICWLNPLRITVSMCVAVCVCLCVFYACNLGCFCCHRFSFNNLYSIYYHLICIIRIIINIILKLLFWIFLHKLFLFAKFLSRKKNICMVSFLLSFYAFVSWIFLIFHANYTFNH